MHGQVSAGCLEYHSPTHETSDGELGPIWSVIPSVEQQETSLSTRSQDQDALTDTLSEAMSSLSMEEVVIATVQQRLVRQPVPAQVTLSPGNEALTDTNAMTVTRPVRSEPVPLSRRLGS